MRVFRVQQRLPRAPALPNDPRQARHPVHRPHAVPEEPAAALTAPREDLAPIEDAGQLRTFVDQFDILPGVKMVEVGGHSDGVSLVLVEDAGEKACFWADVVPTRHHVHLPFIMAYDMNAAKSFEVRSEWIARAAAEGWTCLLYHDPEQPIGRFVGGDRRYGWQALEVSV